MRWNGKVSAHVGTREWLLQRLTAIYIAGYALYLLFRFALAPVAGYSEWLAWFSGGTVRIGMGLFVGSLLIHAWSGMRCVYVDYLRPLWLRFTASFLTGVGLAALALWSADILLSVPK